MKVDDLKAKTLDQLNELLLDLRKEQFNYRFQAGQGQLDNTAAIQKVRRNIARVKTFINQKRREEEAQKAA